MNIKAECAGSVFFFFPLKLRRYIMGSNGWSTSLGMGDSTFRLWAHLLKGRAEVTSSGHKRKPEVVRFDGKSSRLGLEEQLCC